MALGIRRSKFALPLLRTTLALVALAQLSCSSDASDEATTCPDGVAPKVHESEIVDVDTVWAADCGPHVVRNFVRVGEGVTLTIEPGARVELEADAVFEVATESFTSPATLLAKGTSAKPITFTQSGTATWGAIHVQYPGKATFEHAVVEGGGAYDPSVGNAMLAVSGDFELPRKEMLTLAHVTLRDSQGPGLTLDRGAALTVDSTDVTVIGCGKDENAVGFPVVVEPAALDNLPTGDYSGNRQDEILIVPAASEQGGSNVVEDVTIHERGVPYRVGDYAGAELRFDTDDTHDSVTLTIEAGVVLRFAVRDDAASGGRLTLHQFTDSPSVPKVTVKAQGTADKPIVFTSAADSPKPGDWQGLWFGSGANANNVLDHVVIEYAGSDLLAGGFACPPDHSNDGALAIVGGPAENAFLTNSIVRHSASAGVLRGWDLTQGDAVDFKPTNTFEDIAECDQTILRLDAACPNGTCG